VQDSGMDNKRVEIFYDLAGGSTPSTSKDKGCMMDTALPGIFLSSTPCKCYWRMALLLCMVFKAAHDKFFCVQNH